MAHRGMVVLAAGLAAAVITSITGFELSQGIAHGAFRSSARQSQGPPAAEVLAARQTDRQATGGPPPQTAFQPQVHGSEVSRLRTASSRTYAVGGGRLQTILSAVPVNYRDAKGVYRPIDDTLVPSTVAGAGYRNRANSYALMLPRRIESGPVRVTAGSASVAFSLLGAAGSGSVAGASAVYRSALPNVTVTYTATADGVNEILSLQSAAAQSTFTYSLDLSRGLTAAVDAAGAIEVRTPAGSLAFLVPAPSMADGAGATGPARYLLDGFSGSATVTLVADEAWLDDPGRAWPVTIDPPLLPSAPTGLMNNATLSQSSQPLTCTEQCVWAGFDGTNRYHGLVQYDVSSIPGNSQVVDAYLYSPGASTSTQNPTQVGVYAVSHAWTAPTWTTYDGTNPWTTPGGDASSTAAAVVSASTSGMTWPITPVVEAWVSGSSPNYGLLLREPSETVNDVVRVPGPILSQATPPGAQLVVTYTPWLGEQSQYTLQKYPLSDRSQLLVNVANGDLELRSDDLHVKGTGLDLAVSRHYNSLQQCWIPGNGVTNVEPTPTPCADLGYGWTFDTGADVGLELFADGDVDYYAPTGAQLPFTLNADGTYRTPPGVDATLTKNGDGTFTLSDHASGGNFAFSTQGYLTSQADRNGNKLSFAYSGASIASITDTQGRVTTFATANGMISQITDSAGRTYQYGAANSQLTGYTDPAGKTTQYGYDANGNLSQITDPLNNITKLTYDSVSRVTQITFADTSAAGFTYNAGNTVVTDGNGTKSTYYYDNLGRVTKTVDPLGDQQTKSYTSDGHLATSTDPLGGTTASTYDSSNNLTGITSPSSLHDAAAYGDPSHPFSKTAQTSPEGNTTAFAYDANGNVATTTDPNSQTQTHAYNANGTVATYTDARGNHTSFSYDTHGNLTQMTYPSPRGSTTYTYDSLSRVATTTDGAGRTTTFTYDALDRTTRLAYSGGSSVTYAYDADGNRTAVTDASGTTTMTYDGLNRVIKVVYPGGSTVSYGYDAVGNLVSRTDSGGTEKRSYDSINEPVSITDQGGATTTLGYDADHRNTTVQYPNGVTERFAYDGSGLTLSVTATNSSGTKLTSFTYGYVNPATNNATSKIYSAVDVAGNTTRYTYDGAGRLTAAVQTNSSGQTTASDQYAYDPNGNLTSQTAGGTSTSFTNDSDNQMVGAGGVAYSYDGAGNLTGNGSGLSLTYSSSAQTATVTPAGGSSVPMTYRDVGQLQRVGAGSTAFQYDTTGLSQLTAAGQTTDFTHFANGAPLSERVGGSTYYYLHDAMGSVAALLNSAGALVNSYAYDPYGNMTTQTETVSNPFKWIGAVWDSSTGLYKIGARYYAPALGRFTQPDPLSVESPSYTYAGGDPINASDASGLFCCLGWWWNWHWWGYSGGVYFHLSHYDVQVIAFWWPPLAGVIGTIIGAIIGDVPGAIIGAVVGFVIGVVALWPIYNNDLICGCGSWVEIGVTENWWSFWWPNFWYSTWR
jgi:RHS repeat-associated protein